jgi:methionyl aminopeptidase
MIICKSASEIEIMKEAGRIVAEVLLKIEKIIVRGITTAEIDRLAEEEIRSYGAIPAFKGYKGSLSTRSFPGTLCISINEEVVHGIPGGKRVRDGDLVSVDIGVKKDGFYGDAARTFKIGKTSRISDRLWKATKEALDMAIEFCKIGSRLSDISNCIEKRADADGFSVVRDFVGHGIGKSLHEDPQILNYGPPGQGPILKKGMVLAIEPMFNAGKNAVVIADDMWTVVTGDGKQSCHFEDTVAITPDGPEILTRL